MIALPEINFHRTPVTLIIAAVAVALELACSFDELTSGGDAFRRVHYYNELFGILPAIWRGELWRPFTTTLMHGGLLHAAFNVYWILLFGTALENRFGPYRYLGLIVLLGYVSMLPQFIVSTYNSRPQMIVGLSGILYGLLGILIVGRRRHRDLEAVCDASTVQFLLFWLVLCIALTHFGLLPVANIAHVSGLVFGLLYGAALFDTQRRLQWCGAAVLATLVVLAPMVACPGHRGYEAVKQRQELERLLEEREGAPGLEEQPGR